MRDALHPIGVVLTRAHQPQVAQAEVLQRADDMSDVDEILGLVKDSDHAHLVIPRLKPGLGRTLSLRTAIRRAHPSGWERGARHNIAGLIPRAPTPRTAPDPAGRPV